MPYNNSAPTPARERYWAAQRGQGEGIKFIRDAIGAGGPACALWPLSRLPNGYGRLGFNGKPHYAHRLACELAHGPAPSAEHEASHSCGNRACVNPNHLSWKTASGNQYDRRLHGTHEARGGNRLTPAERDFIILLKGRATQRELAALFGVSFQAVSHLHRKGTSSRAQGFKPHEDAKLRELHAAGRRPREIAAEMGQPLRRIYARGNKIGIRFGD